MQRMTQSTLLAAFVAIIGIAGSTQQVRAGTPSEVADAQAEGTKKVAAATKDATDTMADDQRKVTKAENREASDSAEAAYKVAITNSKAIHKTAIERCRDFAGAARKDCSSKQHKYCLSHVTHVRHSLFQSYRTD